MIERVALAIAAADGEDYMEDYRQFDKWARAAIAAMREPTEAVLGAHQVVPDDTDFRELALENWQRMIDAALEEKL